MKGFNFHSVNSELFFVSLTKLSQECFGCLKESIQAGISRILYVEPYDYETDLEEVYQQLLKESGLALVRLSQDD